MKKLFLLRHAKSDWTDLALSDYDRPLNKRGLNDAKFMSKQMKGKLSDIEAIYSSTAVRAKQTTNIFVEEQNFNSKNIIWNKKIYDYHYESERLVDELMNINENYKSVMFVGHNPGISSLLCYLSNVQLSLPTCCIVMLDLHVDRWQDITSNCGEVILHEYPKKYKNQ